MHHVPWPFTVLHCRKTFFSLQSLKDGLSKCSSLRVLDASECRLSDSAASAMALLIRDHGAQRMAAGWQYLLRSYPDERLTPSAQEQVRGVGGEAIHMSWIVSTLRAVGSDGNGALNHEPRQCSIDAFIFTNNC